MNKKILISASIITFLLLAVLVYAAELLDTVITGNLYVTGSANITGAGGTNTTNITIATNLTLNGVNSFIVPRVGAGQTNMTIYVNGSGCMIIGKTAGSFTSYC